MKKCPNNILSTWVAIAAITLTACDGEAPKPAAETPTPAPMAESKPASASTVTPPPAPVTQAPTVPVPVAPPAKPPVVLSNDNSGLVNIAKGKPAKQSSDAFGARAVLAVDGNVDGAFGHGSVTHTSQNANAWLDIDLGNSEKIDHITVWNRTDGSQQRLGNYWIFVSDYPFSPADTVEKLRKIKSMIAIKGEAAMPSFTSPKGVGKGQYVRIQLDGSAKPEDSYLSMAELEVFRAK